MGVFTKLTLDEINELIKDTNIVFVSLQETQNGVTDSTYIGTSKDTTRYIFKVLENSSIEDIKNEIYILNTIKELKVPKVLSEKIVMFQNKPTILFSFIEGKIPKQINIKKVEELAKFMAKLHNIKNIEAKNENIYTLSFMKKMLEKVDDENLKQLLQSKFELIKDINLQNNCLIHGDLFPDNAKFLDDSLSGVYDFAQSCYRNNYFDFAVFIVSWCFDEYDFKTLFLQKAMENYNQNLDIKIIKPYLLYACLYYTLQRANRKNPKKDYNEFLRKFDILKELFMTKEFTKADIEVLKNIILQRRDVRGNRFLKTPIDDEILNEILNAANCAPSVGFSQPWKFILIKDESKKDKIYQEFLKENKKAKKIFKDNKLYPNLKLEGIKESYINLAVLYEKPKKSILGQTSQKKVGEYSVVCAIQNLWLMARAYNIGVGWISILKPKKVKKILNIDKNYKLVAYLAIGYVDEFLDEPELLKLNWGKRKTLDEIQKI